ncbi:MAG: TonB-dependent receptor [Tannerella sp.]|nr:TonB-dependent receptor [Tannerella sp.]
MQNKRFLFKEDTWRKTLCLLCVLFMGTLVTLAQKRVTGTVVDAAGETVIGANVIEKGTTNGIITDADGKFSLSVAGANSVLQISYVGYATQEVKVGNQTSFSITLLEDVAALAEVVVVGYGTQKKATLTGAVAAVKGDEVITTKNENVQNMLTGKVAGVRVVQKTAQPGDFNNNFDIRGMGTPLIIIDGVPRAMDALQRLDPNDIDNLSVLKDASAAIYGVRAANGVVLVTTKKGQSGTIELNYSGYVTAQVPSGLPATLDAIGYMDLRNEKSMHNLTGGSLVYDDSRYQEYLSGQKQSIDWYDYVFAPYAPQTQHNINATGGNDRVNYYVGLGYFYQGGFFKSGDLNYDKYNLRTNITGKITDNLKVDIGVNLVMDETNRMYQDPWWIIRGFWRQNPLIPVYADEAETMLYHGLIEGDNPVSFMDADLTGTRYYGKKWIETSGGLTYEVPWVKGLVANAFFGYDYYVSDTKIYQKEYNQYRYDEASNTYQTYTRQSPNQIQRETYMKSHLLTQVSLRYDNTFDLVHNVSALLGYETNRYDSDNFSAKRQLALQLPYLFAGITTNQVATMNSGSDGLYINANNALFGSVHYSFADKYIVDANFRYDGSSKFASDRRWGLFPGIMAGWRISEEPFFRNISVLSFIDQLKLRASYGVMGDDSASSYQFITGYSYPSGTNTREFTGGYTFDGSFVASATNKGIPNPYITWYTSKTTNFGVDMDTKGGLFGLTLEYFNRNREGLLATRTGSLPTVVGAALPQENINSDRHFGLELELRHRYKYEDLIYSVKAMGSITRQKLLYVERGLIGSSWSNWNNNQNNRLQGVHKGYGAGGQFTSWEEIWNSPVYIGRGTIIGDYYYEDWNGDGQIDGNDSHAIRYNQTPWLNFSLNGNLQWKGFDFDMLWQGSALGSLVYGEQLREPLWGSGESSAMAQFTDRWHPADPKADPYDPRIEWIPGHFAMTGTLPNTNSAFNTEDASYLRLKTVELGYTLPKISGIKNVRIFVNAYNVLTITKVRYVDPEHPADTYGYLYPLNKTYSLGLNVKF